MMDDLISRQAAIYVASGYCHPANIAKELEKLPSAQPERKTGRWIPVTENGIFPKEGEVVLITNDKGNVKYGQYRGINFWSDDKRKCYWWWKKNTTVRVIAWMPKPRPYKGDTE